MHTGLFHTLDFNAEGKFFDFFSMPVSVDRSPYYQVKIPVCRLRRGSGPRILLMAGNHGDEYEGEIVLGHLIRALDAAQITGEITIMPAVNTPAVMAARRCSPLDAGNLNRSFPGNAAGGPTQRIAHFLEHVLFPMHDVVFDLHSGGTSMGHLGCALVERQGTAAQFAHALELMQSTGMSYGFVAENGSTAPTSMAAAGRAGAIGLSGEFGGGGTVTPQSMADTRAAVDRVLIKLGVTTAPVLGDHAPIAAPMQLLLLDTHEQNLFATRRCWFEPVVDLGAQVVRGQLAGWLHDFHRFDAAPEAVHFRESGVVISRRLHTDCESGDSLIQVARPIDAAGVLGR